MQCSCFTMEYILKAYRYRPKSLIYRSKDV